MLHKARKHIWLLMTGVLAAAALLAIIIPGATAYAAGESKNAPQPGIPNGAKPDYVAYIKNGHKPVTTPISEMTPSSVGFPTEKSPPITQKNCYQQPANFDPSTASAADLKKYGLPLQEKGQSRAAWLAIVGNMKYRVCVSYYTNAARMATLSAQSSSHALDINNPQETNSDIWAGNAVDQTCGLGCYNGSYLYTEIDADWNAPKISPNAEFQPLGTANSSMWLGLGGTYYTSWLIQDGTDSYQEDWTDQKCFQWYEWQNNSDPTDSISPVEVDLGPKVNGVNQPINCGDHTYERVSAQNCYQLGDLMNKNYWQDCLGPYGDESTAEGIVERNGGTLGLADFGSATFWGIGATENTLGYKSFPNLRHDYYNMWWNNGWVATTGPIQSDPTDPPYDQYAINWVNGCGGQATCSGGL